MNQVTATIPILVLILATGLILLTHEFKLTITPREVPIPVEVDK